MACLKNDSVRHDSAGDRKFDAHKAIEQANHLACDMLSHKGLNGESLCVDLKEEAEITRPVTLANTTARSNLLKPAPMERGSSALVVVMLVPMTCSRQWNIRPGSRKLLTWRRKRNRGS